MSPGTIYGKGVGELSGPGEGVAVTAIMTAAGVGWKNATKLLASSMSRSLTHRRHECHNRQEQKECGYQFIHYRYSALHFASPSKAAVPPHNLF